MAIEKSWMSAGTTLMVLKLLEEKDMYGYQIIETLAQRSSKLFDLKAGTLYPLLHSLEQKTYITSYEQDSKNGRIRKYYRLTKAGLTYLSAQEKDWVVFTNSMKQVMGGAKA